MGSIIKQFIPGIIMIAIVIIVVNIIDYKRYSKSMYKKETKRPYLLIALDKGLRGEYITSNFLDKIDGNKEFIFNAYIPKQKESETSEIDIIMIHEKGIFVIENKNYAGWIFGKEKDYKWCQSFENKKKYFFYNPIKQNATHIKYLKQMLQQNESTPYISIITFNNNAKLKKLTIESKDIIVTNCNTVKEKTLQLMKEMKIIYTENEIKEIYKLLKEKTNVSQEIKEKHIENIKK